MLNTVHDLALVVWILKALSFPQLPWLQWGVWVLSTLGQRGHYRDSSNDNGSK